MILGSGAFGLEAMEAACRSGAGSITVVMRKRDRCGLPSCSAAEAGQGMRQGCACRWIVPYSEQFKFIMLSHTPFLSKRTTATWINAWLASTYKAAGIEHVAPEKGTACNFTGQCNDAFFRLPKQVLPAGCVLPFLHRHTQGGLCCCRARRGTSWTRPTA